MVEIYCDGSKKDNSATIGIYCRYQDGDYLELMEYIGDLASTTAEVVAIVRAMELAIEMGQQVIIFTEMMDIIRRCTSLDKENLRRHMGSKNRLKRLLATISKYLYEYPDITLQYIRAHSHDLYNCRADRLARSAHLMLWPQVFELYKNNFIGYDRLVPVEGIRLNRFYSQAFYMHMRHG